MDLDYKLFNPKDQQKEKEKNNKNKEHAVGYYKFVNQFRHHLKKIENDYLGEEIGTLENHFNYINKYENEFEEQRENCLNCYTALKEQISIIEKLVPNFDINVFNTFFEIFEEYYSFFTKSQEILKKFSDFNDDTQNLFYICKRKNYCIDALKEFVDKISVEYADKIEQHDILQQKFNYLKESYDKLYKIYQESKSNDLKQYENIDNKELMIKKLNEKIQELNIENDRIKKKYLECSRDLEGLNMAVKVNYVLKSESENYINELKFKMKNYENNNKINQEYIRNLKTENEKLIKEKEYLEEQINYQLDKINKINMNFEKNKSNNINDLIDEREERENENENENENSEEISEFQCGNHLGDLLMDCEDSETEEGQQKENGQVKEDIIISSKNNELQKENNINNGNNKNNNAEDTLLIVKNNPSIDNIKENININEIIHEKEKIDKTVTFDLKNSLNKKKSNRLKNISKFRHAESVKIREKQSGKINSAYTIMFQGNQFDFPSRAASGIKLNYFKQFFFLLYQSMKMNSDKIEPFLEYDPETLYNQCRSEHTPFHKFQNWIEKKLMKKELIENRIKYEDFATITGIFCSSLI